MGRPLNGITARIGACPFHWKRRQRPQCARSRASAPHSVWTALKCQV